VARPGDGISPARREAYAILLRLERDDTHSDDLLRGRRVSALSEQDRNLCTALVMGVLRRQLQLDAAIRPLLARPKRRLDAEVEIALRLGAFQLMHLDRVPSHAAIGESVALARAAGHRFASGMVNAVLRKLAARPRNLDAAGKASTAAQVAVLTGHPPWMVERWADFYRLEAAERICEYGQIEPQLCVRLISGEVEAELACEGLELEVGAILTSARRVVWGDVAATAAFREGQVRIQEEGSQLIAELAGQGTQILDCCAAPGGKTLILAERNPEAEVTAWEISVPRFEAMRTRVAESAFAGRIEVMHMDAAAERGEGEYDLVLADAPCSGTGTLARNPEIRHRLKVEDLARHHERQCAILRGALRAAGQSGARVLYSTCSLEPEENEQVVVEVLADSPEWGRVSMGERVEALRSEGQLMPDVSTLLQRCVNAEGSLSLLPGRAGLATDGFFAAMLERQG